MNQSVERMRMIRDAAMKHSDNGRCWWIKKYIMNAFNGASFSRVKRRR